MKQWLLGLCFFSLSLWGAINDVALPIMNPLSSGDAVEFRMSDYPDGIFVVEAYFLGCPYCNENAPNVNRLAELFKSEPRVHVLDVGIDSLDEQYEEWIQRHSPNHLVLKDDSQTLLRQLKTRGYPTVYVINSAREVVFQTSGVWDDAEFQKVVDAVKTATIQP